jgi:hypothetical protein
MESKKWYQSKTLWVNLLTLTAATIGYIASVAGDLDLNPQVVILLTGVVLPLVNMILRIMTNNGISK